MSYQKELEAIVGADGVIVEACDAYAIDGIVPKWVVRPSTSEQVCQCITFARDRDWKIVPLGGGTEIDVGCPPERVDLVISTERLTAVTYDNRRDMTVRVGAGMTLSGLEELVREDNLWLPVDPPMPEKATIGGVVSANSNGPLRFGKGPLRDHVIGVRLATPDGKLVAAGGTVVKNVAGYDLCKLVTGSLGTLGVLVDVALKLASRSESDALVWASVDSGEKTEEIVAAVMDSSADPILLEAINGTQTKRLCPDPLEDLPPDGTILAFGFDGGRAKVEWQVETVRAVIEKLGGTVLITQHDDAALSARERLVDCSRRDEAPMVLKASVLSSQAVELVSVANSLTRQTDVQLGSVSHAGNGIVTFFADGENAALAGVAKGLLAKTTALGGHLTVCKAPLPLKPELAIWGGSVEAWPMMQKIRSEFDPTECLSPSRFVTAM